MYKYIYLNEVDVNDFDLSNDVLAINEKNPDLINQQQSIRNLIDYQFELTRKYYLL